MSDSSIITGHESHQLLASFARYKACHSLSALAKGCKSMLQSPPFLRVLYREDGTGLTSDVRVKERLGKQSIGRNMMRPAAEDRPSDRRFRRWRKDWKTSTHDPRWYAACLFIACEHERYTGWQTDKNTDKRDDADSRLLALWERHGKHLLKAIEDHQTAHDYEESTEAELHELRPVVEDGVVKKPWDMVVMERWESWCDPRDGSGEARANHDQRVLGRHLLYLAILQRRDKALQIPKVQVVANRMRDRTLQQEPQAAKLHEGTPAQGTTNELDTTLGLLRDFLSHEVLKLELLGDPELKSALPLGCSMELSARIEILVGTTHNVATTATVFERTHTAFHALAGSSSRPELYL